MANQDTRPAIFGLFVRNSCRSPCDMLYHMITRNLLVRHTAWCFHPWSPIISKKWGRHHHSWRWSTLFPWVHHHQMWNLVTIEWFHGLSHTQCPLLLSSPTITWWDCSYMLLPSHCVLLHGCLLHKKVCLCVFCLKLFLGFFNQSIEFNHYFT